MKTKDLIRKLMEEDPSGEEEVCVGNCDIHFVESLPAYYDGSLQVLERDPECNYYNIIGAKYKRSGKKIQIHLMSITDAICNTDGDFPVDYSELPADRIETTKKAHDDLKLWNKNLSNKIESEQFVAWVIEKLNIEDQEESKLVAQRFFEKNISANDPLPDGGISEGMSYISTRKMQWENKFNPVVEEGFVKIKTK